MSTAVSSAAATNAPNMPDAKMPGETVRALVTLWLLFHLFGIVLALTWNPNTMALLSPPAMDVDFPNDSKLLTALKSTPVLSQYMYALWLDWPHDYWLTYGDATDADHTLDITLVYPDGHKQQMQLPPADARGEQRERYKALVHLLATTFYSDSPDKTLLASIGADLLQHTHASEAQIQIRRHTPLSMDDAAASDPGQHDPNNPRTFATVYTGTVTLNSLGKGEVHDQGQLPRDVAPVTGPRSTNRNRNQNQGTETAPSPPPKAFHDILTPPAPPDSTPSTK
jgi:hypothetical protein